MKKNIFREFVVLFSLVFILFGYSVALAEETPPILPVNIHLKIVSGSSSLYDADISVNPCDSDNKPESPDTITAYCSVLQSGISSDWTWYDFGAMLNGINDIVGYTSKDKDNKDVYHYWSWFLNNVEATVGLNMYELKNGDIISLVFIPVEAEIINEAPPIERHVSGGSMASTASVVVVPEKTFSVKNALDFLYKNQKSDKSYGAQMYTDWAAIAISTGDSQIVKSSLVNYFKSNNIDSSMITDYERRAIAMMSLGINPYNGAGVNYIKKIIDSFDGIQFGDKILENDDIFALIVLKNAGYSEKDDIILSDINYLISKQSSDGSFGGIDMTSAFIQAMNRFEKVKGVKDAILKAENYLIQKQEKDGGFGNSFSTSWALQSLGENEKILKAENFLTLKQEIDGGMEEVKGDVDYRVWATAYSIPAVLHKPWSEIMKNFSKPIKKEITKKTLDKFEQVKISAENKVVNTENIIPVAQSNFWGKLKNSFRRFLINLNF